LIEHRGEKLQEFSLRTYLGEEGMLLKALYTEAVIGVERAVLDPSEEEVVELSSFEM
jgi:hypothetical protein